MAPRLLALLVLAQTSGVERAGARVRPPASAAPARSQAEVDDEVRGLLGAIDTPIPASRWQSLGAQARPALEALGADPEALPTRRAKAVDALAALGSEADGPRFLALALDAAAPFVVRLAAVRALGATVPVAALPAALAPALEAPGDSRLRAAAARVLAERAPEACAALAPRVRAEAASVRGQYAPVARACGWAEAVWR
jgi:hypothetical protein